jgi:hypothetical protein
MNHKLAIFFATSLFFVSIPPPANAETGVEVTTVSGHSESCLANLAPDASADACSFDAVLEMGPIQNVSKAMGKTLGYSGVASVSYRDWTQTFVNLNYKEVHKGRFFFDGTYAWSTTSYSGNLGSHFCHQSGSYALLGWVGNIQCTSERSVSKYSLVERETYDYASLPNAPIGFTAAMSVLVNAVGGYVERPY